MTIEPLAESFANLVYDRFYDYQVRFRQLTQRAPARFMQRQWPQIQSDTGERLQLYKKIVDQTNTHLRLLFPKGTIDSQTWIRVKAAYATRVADSNDRELAETFFNSISRRLFDTIGVNQHIEFVHESIDLRPTCPTDPEVAVYPVVDDVESVIRDVLSNYANIHFDIDGLEKVLPIIVERITTRLANDLNDPSSIRFEMVRHPFYRGQGAYIIGRIVTAHEIVPIVLALLNPERGVAVDALILDSDAVSIVFSFTRSSFHVEIQNVRMLVDFLASIMPGKPEAEIYSSIGHFKHGKTMLYRAVCQHTAQCTEDRFRISPGKRGMVMVVFDMAGYEMVVKLIRDRFDNPKKTTRQKVMEQYDFVFNHYRVGRLIEAHTFEQLSFDRCWFSDSLLDFLKQEAAQTVLIDNDRVIIRHAYLERRVVPLDIYLAEASDEKSAAAVVDFGNAIKDLAFANIFTGDMLLKNFGVTRHGRVVFYDYDEIVPLTDCRFRAIPPPRSHLEEMAAEPWYTVEENDVFPEEFDHFLGLPPTHRDVFFRWHSDLLEPDFWTTVQNEIRSGNIRHIRPYHPRYRL